MSEEEKDVISAPSTEQEVAPDIQATQAVTEESAPQTVVPSGEGKSQTEAVDENGVPWKNRAFEWQRKNTELTENLPKIIEETLQKTLQANQQPQKKIYSIAELEAFAQENPNYRPWVEEEKAKLIQENINKSFESKFLAKEEEVKKQSIKQQTEQTVLQQYPNMFLRDATGRPVWNQNDPMTQLVGQYLQDPDLKNHPRGLEVAAKMAYADLAAQGKAVHIQQSQQLKAQVKSMEKKVMPEGGGSPVPTSNVSAFKKAQERLAQSGNLKDAREAVGEYFKAIGRLKD